MANTVLEAKRLQESVKLSLQLELEMLTWEDASLCDKLYPFDTALAAGVTGTASVAQAFARLNNT